MSERFERQQDLVPQRRLAGLTATVIGVGAIGRQVALQLAAIGTPRLQLVDFDRVELGNITTQGYSHEDIGELKVEATRKTIHALDPTIVVESCADRFRPKQGVSDVLFCAVDSISARASIWRAVERRSRFWADGRMLGETIRVLSAADTMGRRHYAANTFPSIGSPDRSMHLTQHDLRGEHCRGTHAAPILALVERSARRRRHDHDPVGRGVDRDVDRFKRMLPGR